MKKDPLLLLGTGLLEEVEDDDEAVKEEVDGDVAAFQEEVSERRHILSVIDCAVCPCRLGSSISHLRDASSQLACQVLQRNSLQMKAPQQDKSVDAGDEQVPGCWWVLQHD